jgi:dihydroorotase
MITTPPILVKNGMIIDSGMEQPRLGSLYLCDGKIQSVEWGMWDETRDVNSVHTIIDAQDCLVCPGFIDIHCHLRDPGFTEKESIASGVRAATAGGFTTVVCMANTNPVNDYPEITRYLINTASKEGFATVYPVSAITKNLNTKELVDMPTMLHEGAIALSNDGIPIMDVSILEAALEVSQAYGVPIMLHEEDIHIRQGGHLHPSPIAKQLDVKGNPSESEVTIIKRDTALLKPNYGHLHMQHLSCGESLEPIAQAQQAGKLVTAELTPHHAYLTYEDVNKHGADAKMAPPLRTEHDRKELVAGLESGIIACFATDHAPHTLEDKQKPFANTPFGIVGFETAATITYQLVLRKELSLKRWVEAWTKDPASIIHRNELGNLNPHTPADILIFDPQIEYTIDANRFNSKGRNTPFHNMRVQGRIRTVLKTGKIVNPFS